MMYLPLAAAPEHGEALLVIVLIQLGVIIGVARIFGVLFRLIGQPVVVGEIVAGVVLGPSVFGKIETLLGYGNHPLSRAIFDPAVTEIFSVMSQVGLILLMFLVGMEFDFSHLKRSYKSAVGISTVGAVVPFGLGWLLAHAIHPYLEGVSRGDTVIPLDLHGFSLFMGTAMAITALPVLGRMMLEFNITRTRLATVTISAAAINDATGWILLAAVSAMVKSQFRALDTLRMVGLTVAFGLAMLVLVRPILVRWIRWSMDRHHGSLGFNAMTILLIVIFVCAIATSLIGIFAIFGAFVLGAVLSDQAVFREAVTRELRSFVTVFFLPIFFTLTGLRTDIGTLSTTLLWGIAGLVVVAAMLGKFGGCTIAARISGHRWRESLCVGAMMNTRGLMELVVINVGYDLGIIPRSVFCMLVMMALVTTLMTTPILKVLKRGTELDEPMEQAQFGRLRVRVGGINATTTERP
jgi:Kef-type K+ transport system membrane component KefB